MCNMNTIWWCFWVDFMLSRVEYHPSMRWSVCEYTKKTILVDFFRLFLMIIMIMLCLQSRWDHKKKFAPASAYANSLLMKLSLTFFSANSLSFLSHSPGKRDLILNGIPDWLYSHTPELHGDTLAFSTNGGYLSFLSFNISNVQKYE